MRKLLRSSDRMLALASVCVIGAAAATLRLEPLADGLRTFLAFAILIAVSELFEVTLPNDVPYSLGLAPGLGYVLLGNHPASEAIVLFGCGMVLVVGWRTIARRPSRIREVFAHTLALSAAATFYAAIQNLESVNEVSWFGFAAGDNEISIVGLATVFVTILLVQTTLQTIRTVEADKIPFGPVFHGQVRSTAALHLSILSVGALLALSYPPLEYWSFPLFLAPLAATQFAFRQFASIRKTYLQTIRALSKVPEMAGYTHPGHSTRVAELSLAIARELGVAEGEMNEIQYAALLHDIGRVSIPEPGEDSEIVGRTQLALVGAAIVRETGHFPRVAEMIENQNEPYRRRGEDANRDLHVGAKIIKVASSYDDMTRPGGIGLSPWDVLERLHLGMAYEYDPGVIQALTRVLEKRGSI